MEYLKLCSHWGLDLHYLGLLDLLASIAEKQGWEKPISVTEMFSFVLNDKKLSKLLGESLLMFKANLVVFSSKGDYQLVYDEDESLTAVLINYQQFNKTIEKNLFQLTICGCNPLIT